MIRYGLENRQKLAIQPPVHIFNLSSFLGEFSLQSLLLPSTCIQQSTERGFVLRRLFIEESEYIDMAAKVRYRPSFHHSNNDIS